MTRWICATPVDKELYPGHAIIPAGLSGTVVLPKASCRSCRPAIEQPGTIAAAVRAPRVDSSTAKLRGRTI